MILRKRLTQLQYFGLDEHTIACLAGNEYKDIGKFGKEVTVSTNNTGTISIEPVEDLGNIRSSFYSVGGKSDYVKAICNDQSWILPKTGCWTIEFFIKGITKVSSMNGMQFGPTYNNGNALYLETVDFPTCHWYQYSGNFSLTNNEWHHTCLINKNNVLRNYVDGKLTLQWNTKNDINMSNQKNGYIMLLNCSDINNQSFYGYQTNVRVSDVARYPTEGFNIETLKYQYGSLVTPYTNSYACGNYNEL